MAIGKLLLRRALRSRKITGKAMSSAQRRALKKAVKASALKRSKRKIASKVSRRVFKMRTMSVKTTFKLAGRRGLKPLNATAKFSGARQRRLIAKYAQSSQFKSRVVNGVKFTPQQQADAMKRVIKQTAKAHNQAIKAYKASQGGIDWTRSILYSVGITAAMNPSATARLIESTAENASYNAERLARKASKNIKGVQRKIRKYKKAKSQ